MIPRTRMGRLAVGGDAAFLVFLGAFIGLVASGQTGGDKFFSNPWLSGSILLAGGAAVASGIVGLVCILTRQGAIASSIRDCGPRRRSSCLGNRGDRHPPLKPRVNNRA